MKKRKPALSKIDREHDHLFRGAFSIKLIAQTHLQEVMPAGVLSELELDSLNLLSESYVDGELKSTFSDVVWACNFREQDSARIAFLFEHKSGVPDYPIAVQLLQYVLGIWQKEISEKQNLSFVIPIIVYHGQRKWQGNSFWEYFKHAPVAFRAYLPEFDYILTDLRNVPDEIIKTKEQLGALRSIYLAFKHAFDARRLKENFREILIFVSRSGQTALDSLLTEMVFTYIQKRLEMEPEELETLIESLPEDAKKLTMSTYDKIIAKGIEKGIEQGIEQGIEAGIEKGIEKGIEIKTVEFIHRLIRSTGWDDIQIAQMAGVEPAYVAQIREELQKTS